MQFVTIMFMVIIGAVIGWITNILAIKLLFRPLRPYKIPLLNYEIQGLLPKRKAEIASNIGKTVDEELLSIEDILNKMIEDEDKSNIVKAIKIRVNMIIDDKMPPIMPSTFKNMIKEYVDTVVEEEIASLINDLSEDLIHKATARINIKEMVEDRINAFEMEKIEDIILSIAKKELKHIERLGGILGGLIGLIQGIIVIMMR
ncbi:conserved protein of unknown function [Acetoanaerobium sticklandii]|uniref:DUF445 family protein n=1 Tax=Acetoanaerobium sticklandii (strain ATCC 12662 / DSM 519 / JCM 1433 / CCUG 9281 / NCIMB 10654 / HF) TaxID=499177 RepID=E3PXT1_ACESD|nr:DUF445 family protein [Acetoanaerobium sticklandii]CBH21246.1 conserved protein of unknown function [Acetoanaerobium sticklandii]